MKTAASLAILTIILAACGGSAVTPTQRPGQATVQPVQPTVRPVEPTLQPVVSGAGTSVAHVVVASGPLAGTYDVTGINYDCYIDPSGSEATFLDDSVTEGLYSVHFATGEGGANPTLFSFAALFGGPSSDQSLIDIDTVDPDQISGSGTAALQDNGSTIKWTVNGTSPDGIGVEATVECGPVDRMRPTP